jgi:hypothetical protein
VKQTTYVVVMNKKLNKKGSVFSSTGREGRGVGMPID